MTDAASPAEWPPERRLIGFEPSPETKGYWDGVKDARLLLKHCDQCGAFLHPRRIVCSYCGNSELAWKEAQGGGSVYTFSEMHRAPSPAHRGALPYCLGIVRLDEGVHLFTRFITSDRMQVAIGRRVLVRFDDLESGVQLPVFELVQSA